MVLWRIGALKRFVEGGLAHISVDGLAFTLKLLRNSWGAGMGWSEFVNLKSDMV